MNDAPDRPVLGAAYMLGASAAFALLGVVVKVASASVPTGEIVLWRSLLSACFVGVAIVGRGRSVRPANLRMHVVRAVVGITSMALYFEAIARLPLGDAVLITYLSPLLVGVASPLVGERPPPRIWAALALGLVGVAFVVGPAASDDLIGLTCAVVAAFCAAGAYLSVRTLTRTDPSDVIVFWFGVIGTFLASPSLLRGTAVDSPRTVGMMLAVGLLGAVAQTLMTQAYAVANAAQVSVVQYATPVFAYGLGLALLHEYPTAAGVVGAACVTLAGVVAARPARSRQ